MKNLIYILSIFISINSYSQKIKAIDFKIVDYEVEANNNLEIKSFAIIKNDGILTVFSDSWDGKNYFQYKLSDEEIDKINSLFEKELNSYIKQKQLNKNQYFAGNPRYISFEINGKKKSLCFIEPFMNNEFMDVLKILNSKIYKHDETAKISKKPEDFGKVKKEIIKRSKIDNYLPEKAVIIQN